MPAPVPYGFGGVMPISVGGTPTLPNLSGFQYVPPVGGDLQSLVNQLHLSPTGPTSSFPRVASGWAGNSLVDGFVPSIPSGPASMLRTPGGVGLSEVPVAIRSGGAMSATAPFEASILAKLGAGAEAAIPEAGGLLSRLKPVAPWAEGAGIKGIIGKSAGPLIASVALNKAGGIAGGDNTFLGRFLKGAGTGATAGIFGPEIGVVGALGMGLFQGLAGKSKDGSSVWLDEKVLQRAGFDDADQAQIHLTYDILKETQGKKAADAAIGQLIMQDISQRQQQKQEDESSQRRMLATQALAAQFFQPFTKQMMDSAQQRYSVSESLAKDLPPEYRSVVRAGNAASLDNANRVATAYASQAQLIPMLATIDYQKGLADQLAQQQAASVIQGMGIGAQGAGGGSLSSLASQLGLQNSQQLQTAGG